MTQTPPVAKTLLFTTLALIAFAANSVLCRLALGEGSIDAAGFTVIRLLAGALVLMTLLRLGRNGRAPEDPARSGGSWAAALMLFGYAITFSFAYITLETGTGALILFGSVQLTMILAALVGGQRLHGSEWAGVLLAFAGFVYLVLPGVSTPSLQGFVLMALAGVAWGLYTLRGRGSVTPLRDTAYNFSRTLPLALLVAAVALPQLQATPRGVVLAALSGALASGIGYSLWYSALRGLGAIQAAVVQLLVPVIAALGGVLFVGEPIALRLVIAAALVLGGILLVVLGRYRLLNRARA